ncbi:MAG: tRNA uridine-5-carboxymethylaminomethyl(34) synthesis GTPase MnmE, partial [Bacteroidetes bacterium]|nr:tRNA uridine-5-carboxymethylaminomethyl(34) synthesis GTPase MnmE [Bacteroidota bacterium]
AHFGRIVDGNGSFVDEVVAVTFRKPSSYTCEDVIEVSCHGGYLVTQKVLQLILSAGARAAEPGEFTKRAFLNGRLDLSQAEAVGDLIHSQSEAAYRSSMRQLSGELSREIKGVRDELLNLASLLELELDFSEEDVEFANRKTLADRLAGAVRVIDKLLASYAVGRVYKEGVRVTIAGKPNAGKSSLLNALLGEKRAIVSEIPGTTRDTISESVSIDGILFRLTDTAGLRETADSIEREGVERAHREAEQADVVLLVIDYEERYYNGTNPLYARLADICSKSGIKLVKVWNKIDLYRSSTSRGPEDGCVFYVSALTGEGIDFLRNGLSKVTMSDQINESSVVVTNARHRDALARAKKSLGLALDTLASGKSGEFVALDLRAGLNALGEITGEITTEDVLNNIFSKFCIGK